jgi:thiol-disulfide isomerase/thioredoxin
MNAMSAAVGRIELAGIVILGLVAAYWLVTRFVLARARRGGQGIASFTPGTPGILYFTTASCVTCKAAQAPALRALAERLSGKVQVIEVDAIGEKAVAKKWSVLSVPTTFVLDGTGRPRHVNHGFASTEKLIGQIRQLAQI